MDDPIEIRSIGLFTAVRDAGDEDDEIYCYASPVWFKNSDVDVLIHPNDDGSPLRGGQLEELSERFARFTQAVRQRPANLSHLLRSRAADRGYDLDQVSDDDLWKALNWQNIKLERNGTVECYARLLPALQDNDVVLRFSASMELVDVALDG